MSAIKEKDILRFLDGKSSRKESESIKSWMLADGTNNQSVIQLKTIVEEAPKLDSFNLVDEDVEWKRFLEMTTPELNELQILNHLDGLSSYSDKKKVETWSSESESNKNDLDIYELIIQEAPHLASYKMTNEELEWKAFQSGINQTSNVAETPVISLKTDRKAESKTVFLLWQKIAVAAAVAILFMSIWVMKPQDAYGEFITTDNQETVQLVDGSTVELASNSKLRYPKSLRNVDERRLFLTGRGKFDVAKNEQKPFVVEVNDRIGIEVLGTVFKLGDDSEFIEVVENLEGKVKAFELINPGNNVVLEPGDKFGFDGERFIDMNQEPEIVDNAIEHQILDILDYLMEVSEWRVISSPYTEFVEDGIVKVDLDQSYEKILEDLNERADFEYEKLSCEGCFIIQKFRPYAE